MAEAKEKKPHLAGSTLCALGVVFGDIGTSPLYAMRQCFQDLRQPSLPPEAVLGILSLIFWSLILVVCVKYLTFILRADHEGEGGTLALLALIQSRHPMAQTRSPGVLVLVVLFGSALLYGDGVITPAISVLSAVEGLQIATPSLQSFVVPISVGLLAGLFLLQRRGTGLVGNLFGPVMILWFVSIAVLGVRGIVQGPRVLEALNPFLGFGFLAHHGGLGLIVLGGVVLCFSGAEALFADLGHFGRVPIELCWYGLVLPALVVSYFGQGALMLQHPTGIDNPFFTLVPRVLLYPMVGLATAATIIASQALISGLFSLTQQAIHMGYFPRLEIIHTSKEERGQVYIAAVNYALMAACIAIVLGFRSSARLGGAYGLAVIGTMTITSITYFVVLRKVWKWPAAGSISLVGFFLFIDLAFLAGNLPKVLDGAWVPIVIAALVFAVFWIWTEGQVRFRRALRTGSMPLNEFKREMRAWRGHQEGTGVFFTTHADSVPLVGKNLWLRAQACHEQTLLVTLVERKIPYVACREMAVVDDLAPGFRRLTASFGFMQHPDITQVIKNLPPGDLPIDWDRLVCYLPQPHLVIKGSWGRQRFQQIYRFLWNNSLSSALYFRVPPREVVHIGVRLEL